jgi:hypothetical protein
MNGPPTAQGFEPRLKRRLVAGLVVGVLVGATLGALMGILAFDGRGGAIVACVLAGTIGGLLYGALVGSFSGLESPNPGAEPSETTHPLAEPAIDEEHDPPLRSDQRGDRPAG